MPSILSHKKMFSEPSSPTPTSFQFQYGTEQRARDWRCFLYEWDQILFLGSLVYRLSDFLDIHLHHLFYPSSHTPPITTDPLSCSWNRHDLKGEDIFDQNIPQNKTGASHCIAEERHKEDKISLMYDLDLLLLLKLASLWQHGKQAMSLWVTQWRTEDSAVQFSSFLCLAVPPCTLSFPH